MDRGSKLHFFFTLQYVCLILISSEVMAMSFMYSLQKQQQQQYNAFPNSKHSKDQNFKF